jgi:hypothetical protein
MNGGGGGEEEEEESSSLCFSSGRPPPPCAFFFTSCALSFYSNHFSSEALPNALPDGQNNPQRVCESCCVLLRVHSPCLVHCGQVLLLRGIPFFLNTFFLPVFLPSFLPPFPPLPAIPFFE